MNALDLLYIPLAVATAPWWARKQRSGWGERFGRIAPLRGRPAAGAVLGDVAASRGTVLLHAVSVGEVNSLRQLAPLLAREARVVVSVGTDTGIKRARELFAATCDVVRYPLDASWAVRRFLDATRPDVVALVELEVWPNFVRECRRRGIPVCVINGRLSARSYKGYRRLRWFFRPLFSSLEFAAVQDADYAARFEAMGVGPERCLLTGSMKWDSAKIGDGAAGAEALAREMGIGRGPGAPPLIVAGSTGPGEEGLLCRIAAGLERELGPVQLLCAPRKPERFDEAAAAMGDCVRRSGGSAGARPMPVRRFLLDTIGELRKAYALADVVVVGRSFGALYGSDPIEPIALGKPTVIGPAVSDFAQVVAAFERGGGIARATRESLGSVLRTLLTDVEGRRELAERGRAVIRREQGASARHAELLLDLLDQAPPGTGDAPAAAGDPARATTP
jgi:3-deoxy-D-manno-octulosonic-acid transferase